MTDHGKLSAATINEAIAKDQGWKKKTWRTPFGDREYWLSPDGREEGDVPDYCGSLDDTWELARRILGAETFLVELETLLDVGDCSVNGVARAMSEMIYEKVVGK